MSSLDTVHKKVALYLLRPCLPSGGSVLATRVATEDVQRADLHMHFKLLTYNQTDVGYLKLDTPLHVVKQTTLMLILLLSILKVPSAPLSRCKDYGVVFEFFHFITVA